MTWSRSQLEAVAGARLKARAVLEPVEEAALAYARWQGLTDEENIDQEAAKAQLDRTLESLDAVGPTGWSGLAKLADDLGDDAIIGLMKYSLERSASQVREQVKEGPSAPDEQAGVAQTKKKGRDRSR